MFNVFGGYLILKFFHCFSSGNSLLNLDNLIPLISFHGIFSALSKYALHFNVAFLDISEMKVFVKFPQCHSICCSLKTVEIRPGLIHSFMLHMSSSITPINILHHYGNTLLIYFRLGKCTRQ